MLVMAAAVSDYAPKGKISGGRSITLKLEKTPKIIDGIKKIQKDIFPSRIQGRILCFCNVT